MLTVKMIREDLKEIRYYMSRKEVFEKSVNCVGKNRVAQKMELYNHCVLKLRHAFTTSMCRYIWITTHKNRYRKNWAIL